MDDGAIQRNGGGMTIGRALVFAILMSAVASFYAGPAMAQACTRQGIDVACDDGRRGILSGDAIIWPGLAVRPDLAASEHHHRQ